MWIWLALCHKTCQGEVLIRGEKREDLCASPGTQSRYRVYPPLTSGLKVCIMDKRKDGKNGR
jgi:hypothetical protein